MTSMNEPKRRRRRPPVSCIQCRARKVKCNREMPCSNCVASHRDICVYEGYPPLSKRLPDRSQLPESTRASEARSSEAQPPPSTSAVFTTTKSMPGEDIQSMRSKIKQLEDELSDVNSRLASHSASHSVPTPGSNAEFSSSLLGGGVELQQETYTHGQIQEISHGLMHKTRLFGRSHWMVGVAPVWDLVESLEPYMREGRSTAATSLQRCKSLARTIKTRREPVWPAILNASLPEKSVADKLVAHYLRTIETVFRIVHIPTFRRSYEAIWSTESQPDMAVLSQVKLVMAIGTTMNNDDLSLRDLAVQWIYEVQTWLSRPVSKARLNLQTLQTEILLLLAREIVGVDSSSSWVSVGMLVRKAVQMGLHRDPAKLMKGTEFASEMRRRLFNTIVELALQSSILSGGPPFIDLDEFDTKRPGNFDDELLMTEDPSPQPDSYFTQSTVVRLLSHTFPARLAIAKFLNNTSSSCTYEEALRLDSNLRASYKAARKIFLPNTTVETPKGTISNFASTFVDVLINHYLFSLHTPFHTVSLSNTAYAFTRKVMADSSLKIWRGLIQPPIATRASSNEDGYDDITSLTTSPWYFFHTLLRQVSLAISTELRVQLREEEDSLGPIPLRADLVSVMEQAKQWFFRCIELWNTNVKGYLLMRIVAAPIEAYMQGIGQDRLPQYLTKTVEDALAECLVVLEKTASSLGSREEMKSIITAENELPSTTTATFDMNPALEMSEDWDFMMANVDFDSGSAEPIDWLFDETVWKV